MAKKYFVYKKMSFDKVRVFIIQGFSGYPTHTHTKTNILLKYAVQVLKATFDRHWSYVRLY